MSSAPVQEFRLTDPNTISRHSEWDFDFRQIGPGAMEINVLARCSPRVTLMEFSLMQSVHQKGQSPTDTVSFGLPVARSLHSWRGANVDTPGILNLGNGSEFEGVNGPDFVGLTVSISPHLLVCMSDQLGMALPNDFFRRTMLPVRRKTPAVYRLCQDAQALVHNCDVPFGDLQQDDFVAALINAVSDAEEFDDRSAFTVRARSVSRAVDIMNDRLGDDISIGQLCTDSGASMRTLSRGFRERFGIGPKAYLNRLRLCRVKSDLLQASSNSSVVDAANKWGFWHMGQFARDYRQMFGELPSQTINGRSFGQKQRV